MRDARDDEMEVVLKDGTVVKTGNICPDVQPLRCPPMLGNIKVFSEEDCRKLAANPHRTRAREIFKGEDWFVGQKHSDCNGQAGALALATLRVKVGLPAVKLSGSYLYSQINGGRDQGSMLDDGMAQLEKGGTCRFELCGLDIWHPRDITPEMHADARRHKAYKCYRVNTEKEMVSALLGHDGVLVVATHVDRDFSELDSQGFVPPSATGQGNHAERNDDTWYDTRKGCWVFDLPNSWGLRWGVGGRGLHTFKDHFRTTIRNHAFYALIAAKEDPNNPDRTVAA